MACALQPTMECCVTLRLAEIPVAIPFQLRKGIGRSVANLSLDLSSHETEPLVRRRYSGRGHDFGTSFDLPKENWVRFAEKRWAAIAGFEISRAARSPRVMAVQFRMSWSELASFCVLSRGRV